METFLKVLTDGLHARIKLAPNVGRVTGWVQGPSARLQFPDHIHGTDADHPFQDLTTYGNVPVKLGDLGTVIGGNQGGQAMSPRPCLECGTPTTRKPARCDSCERQHQTQRNATRTHYHGDYARRAAQVRANAVICWLCGVGPRCDDPWQADHLIPGDLTSPLLPAHRSCNARRGNRVAE